ncbi:unnamed protein product [Alopecurus aequalis]
MGATIHPRSLTSRGSAAVLRTCASTSIRINPACVAKPTAAVAKKQKRPGSFLDGDSPAKRARGACGEVEADASTKIKRRPCPSSNEDRCPLGSLRNSVEAVCVTKNQDSASSARLPEVAEVPAKPPVYTMRELLEKARLAKARSDAPDADAQAVHRREIERRRAEARREREQMVQTVEFNDPFIDFQDVLKWRLEFISRQRKLQGDDPLSSKN